MSTNWEKTTLDLGTISGGKTKDIEFKALSTIEPIDNIIPSCGCMNTVYDINNKTLNVKFYAEPIPLHLLNEKSYVTVKHIKIVYVSGTIEQLNFKIKITR